MNRETIQEVLNKFAELNSIEIDSSVDNLVDLIESNGTGWRETFKRIQLPEAVTLSVVERFGGEDQGSSYWAVLKVTKGDESAHIKFDGWYASYDGGYLDNVNFAIVEARPVQATEWTKVG